MPSKYLKSHPGSTVKNDFEAAITRLLGRTPVHPSLVKKQKAGALKLSLAAVAMEAGHSRTLITGPNCEYPEIRERVTSLIAGGPQKTTKAMTRTVQDLREENAKLRSQLALIATQYAAIFQHSRELEKQVENERNRVKELLDLKPGQRHLILHPKI